MRPARVYVWPAVSVPLGWVSVAFLGQAVGTDFFWRFNAVGGIVVPLLAASAGAGVIFVRAWRRPHAAADDYRVASWLWAIAAVALVLLSSVLVILTRQGWEFSVETVLNVVAIACVSLLIAFLIGGLFLAPAALAAFGPRLESRVSAAPRRGHAEVEEDQEVDQVLHAPATQR